MPIQQFHLRSDLDGFYLEPVDPQLARPLVGLELLVNGPNVELTQQDNLVPCFSFDELMQRDLAAKASRLIKTGVDNKCS